DDHLFEPSTPSIFDPSADFIKDVIHLPGLRGNPARTYPITAVETTFPGTFHPYTASVITQWQDPRSSVTLDELNHNLHSIGLAHGIEAKNVSDTEVELRVSRILAKHIGEKSDTVSIADVGLGVSQTLPVLVALLVARPGQLVFIEQPEIHLHPRAQFRLSSLLVAAPNRGVRVGGETRSSITLLGIQAAVAEGTIDGRDVALHWFSRDRFGQTHVQSVEMGESGEFGDWPEDFSDVYLQAQGRYLDAVERRQLAD